MVCHLVAYSTQSLNLAFRFLSIEQTGLESFHQAGYVHRDIKPHNMIVTNKLELKFIDFGFTTKVKDDGTITGNKGTPGYSLFTT
jgi:serine/threonine protein kinase